MPNNPKGAWKTHRVCERCKVTRTKNKHCSKCEPVVRAELKKLAKAPPNDSTVQGIPR